MVSRRWRRIAKNLAAFGCLALCLGCGLAAASSWRAPDLFVPAGEAALPDPLSTPAPASPAPEMELLFLDGGVVPVHGDELPGAAATPDPDRPSGPVEEITLDGGAPVAGFFVKDTSGSGADLAAELDQAPSVSFYRDGRPEILIYHTHTSEAYSQNYTGFYYTDMDTRTADQDRSVVAAGRELAAALEARGYGVIHDTTVCDETFNGSYARSWEVLQRNLAEAPSLQVTIDLHRDSMTTAEGLKYKPTVEIAGRKAAQMMLLAGSDADGEWGDFPRWEENLRLILRIQRQGTLAYPSLLRPLNFSDCKYNMNATPGSLLVEVGTEVTTVSEARYAAKLLGGVLADTFDQLLAE